MSAYRRDAENLADHAARKVGEEKQTEAIGVGLAAVTFALLAVAEAISTLAKSQDQN